MTRGETHDTSRRGLSRIRPVTRRRGGRRRPPLPTARARRPCGNSVASERRGAPAGASAGPSPRRVPVATTRATVLSATPRAVLREEAAAKEAAADHGEGARLRSRGTGERPRKRERQEGGTVGRPRRRRRTTPESASRASAPSASAMPSVAGALARQKERRERGGARPARPPRSRTGARGVLPPRPGARTVAATRRRRLRSGGWTCAGIPPRLERDARRRPARPRRAAQRAGGGGRAGRPGGTTSSSGS